jgi:phosphomannomutase
MGERNDGTSHRGLIDRLSRDSRHGPRSRTRIGAAGPILDMLVERLPGQHHAIFTQVDGRFPNHL